KAWLSWPALAASGYLACAAATSSSLAWPKAATAPRPTAATSAAENIKRFIGISSPLGLYTKYGRGREIIRRAGVGQTPAGRMHVAIATWKWETCRVSLPRFSG